MDLDYMPPRQRVEGIGAKAPGRSTAADACRARTDSLLTNIDDYTRCSQAGVRR